MVYLSPDDKIALKKYAIDHDVRESRLIREGVQARISGDSLDPYTEGYNAGLMDIVEDVKTQTLFHSALPSGKKYYAFIEETADRLQRKPIGKR